MGRTKKGRDRRRAGHVRRSRAIASAIVGSLVGLCALTAAIAAPFPVNESFGGATTTNPGWKLAGTARLTNEGDGWLRLTSADEREAGTALLDDAFSSSLGIVIEFDYAMYGGSPFEGNTGDGFSLFLIDGTRTTGPGAPGAGLGYSCASEQVAPTIGVCDSTPGVNGGVVGIGFDQFGNYSGELGGPGFSPGAAPRSIALRGAGSGTSGYRYLTGATVPSGLATGSRAGARRVRITIISSKITVELSSATGTQKVIDAYDLVLAPDQPAIPPTLKLGFSASTGAATNVHEIRNLTVAVPVDLGVETTAPATVDAGGTYTAQLKVTNAGPNVANGSTLRADVPSVFGGLAAKCTAAGGAACEGRPAVSGNRVELPVDVPVGGTVTLEITGTAAQDAPAGDVTTTGVITPPAIATDVRPANNTSRAVTAVRAAPATTTTTSTTSTSMATTTTSTAPAPAPDDELPRTGMLLRTGLGALLLMAGLAGIATSRRQVRDARR